MTDLTKEDQAVFDDYKYHVKPRDRTLIDAFKAACAYKQKRIDELEDDKESLLKHIDRMRREWELRTEAMRQQLFKFAELQPPTPIIIRPEGGGDE